LLVEEPESGPLAAYVDERLAAGETFASSHLLVTELHRLAARVGAAPTSVTAALSVLALTLPDAATFRAAGLLAGQVRSLDALHVASALDLGVVDFVSYDQRQLAAAATGGDSGGKPRGCSGGKPSGS
jgi:predicted nucleic acid-binding protein